MQPPFMFILDSIYKDENSLSIVRNIVLLTVLSEANAQKLVQIMFAAMTKDVNLSWFDPTTDIYLLVLIERVNESHLLNSSKVCAGMAAVPTSLPFIMRSIPKKRMHQIMKWYDDCFCWWCGLATSVKLLLHSTNKALLFDFDDNEIVMIFLILLPFTQDLR